MSSKLEEFPKKNNILWPQTRSVGEKKTNIHLYFSNKTFWENPGFYQPCMMNVPSTQKMAVS